MCYYFDDIMEFEDINVDNILLDEKSYENILVYNRFYTKNLWMQNHCVLCSIKMELDDGIRYLELSNSYNEVYYWINSRIYHAIFDRINYFTSEKSDDKYSIDHNPVRIRTDSYHS